MLSATNVTKRFGGAVVLDSVSISVDEGSRIGVVGPNGIGKSTLLRILAGTEEIDSGRVERAPRSTTVGFLPQEPDARPGETLHAYLARRTGVAAAEAEFDRWTAALADDPDALDPYTEALEAFLALGGDDFDARIGSALADVGLPASRLDVEVGHLSGGQAARAALAAILLARFDVLLLDEPTNNLDFEGLDTLEGFLASRSGAVVVVSHDRAFLDRAVDRIVEITEEHHRAVDYAGGWSDYIAARAQARGQQYEAYDKFKAEKRRLEDRARTQKQWAVQGKAAVKKKGETDKHVKAFKIASAEKQASKVKITERAIDRLVAVDKPWEGWRLEMQLKPTARSGDVVARLEGAVVQRGDFRLGPVDLEISWQERVALLGPNGSGKTTLLQALLGRIPLTEGRRWIGPGVVVGEMDQTRLRFAPDAVLIDAFLAETGMDRSEGRSLLAKFGLGSDHVGRETQHLSPGERSRGILAALMAQGVNCLILDEPTNHLDLEAIEQLEQALEGFDGTLILVTHDRRLLESVQLTRTIELEAATV
jgi:ATPase subunit of ABC transporter with duplicated ATPase domains